MKVKAGLESPYEGHLGRTAKTSVLISSADGPVFPANVYTSVNVTKNPELRDALVDGTLNTVACPYEEGRTYRLAIPVHYHDEDNRLFVLVIPEELRHEEFKRRSDLLQELARERETLPDYVREFQTIFDTSELDGLAKASPKGSEAEEFAGPDEKTSLYQLPVEGPSQEELDARQSEREEQWKQKEEELQEAWDSLKVERDQLNEVATRMERDSARVEETMSRLEAEREELETLKKSLQEEQQSLDVERLNLEQERLRIEQGAPKSAAEESTQVVTDDQFIEVISDDSDEVIEHDVIEDILEDESNYEIEEIPPPPPSAEATQITDSPFEPKRPEPMMETFRALTAKDIPARMEEERDFIVRRTTELP
ncbi:MAG: CpXC domain-containing protein, partial [Bradymonadaceae bacterium]